MPSFPNQNNIGNKRPRADDDAKKDMHHNLAIDTDDEEEEVEELFFGEEEETAEGDDDATLSDDTLSDGDSLVCCDEDRTFDNQAYAAYLAGLARAVEQNKAEEVALSALSREERTAKRRTERYRCGHNNFIVIAKEGSQSDDSQQNEDGGDEHMANAIVQTWDSQAALLKRYSFKAVPYVAFATADAIDGYLEECKEEGVDPTAAAATDADRLLESRICAKLNLDASFDCGRRFEVSHAFNRALVLWQGDITALEIGAIVNAAKSSLMGGGGIDGAIHGAAGPLLKEACRALVKRQAEEGSQNPECLSRAGSASAAPSFGGLSRSGSVVGCPTGETRLTKGFNLPASFVLHTVGPIGEGDAELRSCYWSCLETAKAHNARVAAAVAADKDKEGQGKGGASYEFDDVLQHRDRIRSIAFCGVSTGIFGFPLVRAAHIALRCVREWMELNADTAASPSPSYGGVETLIFCCFTDQEREVYARLMPSYFPVEGFPAVAVAKKDRVAVPIA